MRGRGKIQAGVCVYGGLLMYMLIHVAGMSIPVVVAVIVGVIVAR